MKKSKHRTTETIQAALSFCQTMIPDIKRPIQTEEDVFMLLKTLFVDGFRLCKYREQVKKIKPENDDVIQMKNETVSAIDLSIITFLEMIEKIIRKIKENQNQ